MVTYSVSAILASSPLMDVSADFWLKIPMVWFGQRPSDSFIEPRCDLLFGKTVLGCTRSLDCTPVLERMLGRRIGESRSPLPRNWLEMTASRPVRVPMQCVCGARPAGEPCPKPGSGFSREQRPVKSRSREHSGVARFPRRSRRQPLRCGTQTCRAALSMAFQRVK